MKHWTASEKRLLVALLNQKLSAKKIALKLNRTTYSVVEQKRKMKNSQEFIKTNRRIHWPKEKEDVFVKMIEERASAKEIAIKLNEKLMNVYAKFYQLYRMKFKDYYKLNTRLSFSISPKLPYDIERFISVLKLKGAKEVIIKF